MSIIDKFESILEGVRKVGYWKLPIPSDVDEAIKEQIRSYRKDQTEMRTKIKSNLSDGVIKLLLFFSERMATYTLRMGSQEVFDDGLAALELVFEKTDLAEVLICFSLYYDVSKKYHLNFPDFAEYNELFAEALKQFLSRSENDKSIGAMRYVVIEDDDSQLLSYKRDW